MGKKIVVDLEVNSNKGVKEVKKLNKELNNTNKELSGATNTLDSFTGGAVTKIKGFKGAIGNLAKGFKSLRVAIISTGIGALIIAITAVAQAFRSTEEGQNKFAKLMAVLGAVTDVFTDRLAALGRGLINLFTNPIETLKNFGKSIKEFVMDKVDLAVKSLGLMGSAISKLFKGDFSGALNDAKDGIVGLNKALNPTVIIVDALTKSTKELVKELKEEAKIAGQIADQRAKADKLDRELIVSRAEANRDRAELLEKAVNKEKFSLQERIGFLTEAGKLEEDITNKEIKAAELRLDAKVRENALGDSNKQDLEEEARLKAELINLETAKLTKQKLVTSQLNALLKEESAKKKAVKDKEKEEKNKELQDAKDSEIKRLESIDKIQEDFKNRKQDKEAETEIQKIELEQQRTLEELDRLNATEEQKANIKLYYADLISKEEEKNEETKKKLAKIRTQQTLGDAQNTFNQIAQLAGKDSKVGKAMAIASATISGVQGVQNAYTTAQKSPITLAFPAYPAISAGLAGAVALKNIASIKSVNPSGGGGASVTKPSVPTGASTPPSFNVVGQSDTNQLASAIGGQSQQPVQAYVVANDVTTAQSMDRNIIDDASLGD
jgi:hypothetical protein